MSAVYLDSSAAVKLVLREVESAGLGRFLRGRDHLVSSALARTEVVRAVRHRGPDAVRRAREVLDAFDLLALDDEVLDDAAMLEPAPLRSLDAIHIVSARSLGDDLDVMVTYDARMASAARSVGLPVEAPGAQRRSR